MIPAYINNGKINDYIITIIYSVSDFNGINGTNHQCSSGGLDHEHGQIQVIILEINMRDTVLYQDQDMLLAGCWLWGS